MPLAQQQLMDPIGVTNSGFEAGDAGPSGDLVKLLRPNGDLAALAETAGPGRVDKLLAVFIARD